MRENILLILRNLINNITSANTIYAVNESEVEDRRRYQTEAIANCEQLLQEMQYVISVLPCDINKFMPYVGLIEEEIKLLKGWRKSNSKILRLIKEGKRGRKKKDDVEEE